MTAAARAITRAEGMGISLRLDGGVVHLSGAYAPPDDLLDQLRVNKGEVINLLARRAGLEPPTPPPLPPVPEPEPLAQDDEREVMAAHYSDPGEAHDSDACDPPNDALTAGLLHSARLRPSRWQGGAAIPSPGVECTDCGGRRWWGNLYAWHCAACHPIPLGLHDVKERTT